MTNITLPYGFALDGVEYCYVFRDTDTPSRPRGIPYTTVNYYAHTIPIKCGYHTLNRKALMELGLLYYHNFNDDSTIMQLPQVYKDVPIHWFKVLMRGYRKENNSIRIGLMPLLKNVTLQDYKYDEAPMKPLMLDRDIFFHTDRSQGSYWFTFSFCETQNILLLENQTVMLQSNKN